MIIIDGLWSKFAAFIYGFHTYYNNDQLTQLLVCYAFFGDGLVTLSFCRMNFFTVCCSIGLRKYIIVVLLHQWVSQELSGRMPFIYLPSSV